MRTERELDEAYLKVGNAMIENEDDETLQAIYDTLRWCDGGSDFENTIGQYLPD